MASSKEKITIHILYVDDDSSVQEITKLMLQDIDGGFDIDHACCVDEGFSKLAAGHYDVVVSDYELPQKDGLQFLKELREQKNNIPFILFTGKGREQVAIQALNLGADGYINKQGNPQTVYGELAYGIQTSFEHKKAIEGLAISEDKFRAYVENSPVALFVVDSKGKYVDVNDAACKLLSYSRKELLKLGIVDLLFEKDISWGLKQLSLLNETGKARFEVELKKKDESPVFVILNAAKLPDGKLMGYCEDITELKKTEAQRKVLERKIGEYSKHLKCMVDLRTVQLKDANERIVKSERLAAIGELAGMVGHDLRNPLAGIKNAVYYLKKKGTDISETKSKEMLEIIDKAIDHSDSIINDLLDYSREIHLEQTKYVTKILVDEAIGMIQVPERIQIINNVPDTIWIWVNADKMMRVFINFINNGIDAIPEKGIITITSCQTRNYMKIKFSDTGKGIPEETLKKLFTPLFTTKAQGMGFGLSICKRIVESHGGTITVKTAINKGTTFTIALPIKPKGST